MNRNRKRLHRALQLAVFIAFYLTLANCGKSGGGTPVGGGDNFDDSLFDDSGSSSGDFLSPGTGPVGSGAGGAITDADMSALQDVFANQQELAPEDDGGLSDFLKAEAQRLLEEERRGKEVAVEKMALAGRMLTECAKKVAPLAPIPGQPLLGLWQSTSQIKNEKKFRGTGNTSTAEKCPVKFTIAGGAIVAGSAGAGGQVSTGAALTYTVTGGTKGSMRVTNVGDGQITAKPFSGRVTDRPSAAKGTVTNPEFTKTKYGFEACSTNVSLAQSNNPIPANYQEAMKSMGLCFRQALVLMSPIFDQMFANMDPALRQILMSRMLGLGGGSSSGNSSSR